MVKKILISVVCFCALYVVFAGASAPNVLTVGGAVKQPLSLSFDDLAKRAQVTVRLAEVTSDKNYNGVFLYSGVPLKTILENAHIEANIGLDSNFISTLTQIIDPISPGFS